ncbi:hypothetical protein EDC04DRAFT_2582052 [Pisolithus marmoratus]|nr:hypothetical protein EDC04DRAFT_2582052 [Pisolithus marmoratus]
MTAAYAFTNYQSQDQTICYVLMDIARSLPGTLNLSNLYVMLSKNAHSMDLLTEDDHLHLLDEETWKWWVQMMTDN